MKLKNFSKLELIVWALWLGSLWFLAIVVAPALFKWLPRPEAGLVAGRMFYLMSWYSTIVAGLLILLSGMRTGFSIRSGLMWALGLIALLGVLELLWLTPVMHEMRQAMSVANAEQVAGLRAQFGTMHAVSSVLYAVKMIAGLTWGVLTFQAIRHSEQTAEPS